MPREARRWGDGLQRLFWLGFQDICDPFQMSAHHVQLLSTRHQRSERRQEGVANVTSPNIVPA